ncbi:STAS domain-containing protein [Saccharothrix algeriensis]|uniref:Anti-sigma factor antagonist n=1 Tax=Saccharothrix algeriensis TaxID=173560 RepID=A0A8T8HVQ0_9PSEU|nr:STAS domain-containing protein [Saccharothrix algeriensis]MBM7814185.1 anti-sigma B factor antagonist [Saccharothrix algeriensis]QTR02552.1 STAS domain-containing protein [Saccharothrix algeriensis]
MDLQVRSEVRGGWTVVAVSGELDADTVPVLSDLLEETSGDRVVVDLSGVPFMDTTGLSLMLDWHRRLDGTGGQFRMAALQSSVRRLFRLTELSEVMHIHDSVEDATT